MSSLLAQPLKLRLRCATAEGDAALEAYLAAHGLEDFTILIEPMASVKAIRDFLDRRLNVRVCGWWVD